MDVTTATSAYVLPVVNTTAVVLSTLAASVVADENVLGFLDSLRTNVGALVSFLEERMTLPTLGVAAEEMSDDGIHVGEEEDVEVEIEDAPVPVPVPVVAPEPQTEQEASVVMLERQLNATIAHALYNIEEKLSRMRLDRVQSRPVWSFELQNRMRNILFDWIEGPVDNTQWHVVNAALSPEEKQLFGVRFVMWMKLRCNSTAQDEAMRINAASLPAQFTFLTGLGTLVYSALTERASLVSTLHAAADVLGGIDRMRMLPGGAALPRALLAAVGTVTGMSGWTDKLTEYVIGSSFDAVARASRAVDRVQKDMDAVFAKMLPPLREDRLGRYGPENNPVALPASSAPLMQLSIDLDAVRHMSGAEMVEMIPTHLRESVERTVQDAVNRAHAQLVADTRGSQQWMTTYFMQQYVTPIGHEFNEAQKAHTEEAFLLSATLARMAAAQNTTQRAEAVYQGWLEWLEMYAAQNPLQRYLTLQTAAARSAYLYDWFTSVYTVAVAFTTMAGIVAFYCMRPRATVAQQQRSARRAQRGRELPADPLARSFADDAMARAGVPRVEIKRVRIREDAEFRALAAEERRLTALLTPPSPSSPIAIALFALMQMS